MAGFGDLVGGLGHALGLPELGISELLGGNKSQPIGDQSVGVGDKWINGQLYDYAGDPVAPPIQDSGQTPYSAPAGGSSGGGANINDLLLQLGLSDNNINSQLGRIGTQRDIANQNIDSSYNSGFNRLTQQQQDAQQAADASLQKTIGDNVTARNNIDATTGRQTTSLQRLLGAKGAGNSSAAKILVPYAAGLQGNQQLQQVGKAYTDNLTSLSTADQKRKNDFTNAFGDLASQRDNARSSALGGLASTEAQLQQQKGELAAQRAQLAGKSTAQALAALTPYQDRVNQLLGQVDQYGKQVNFTPQVVDTSAPTLGQYNYTKGTAATIGSDQSNAGLNQLIGPYSNLIDDKKKQQPVVV